MKVKELFKKMDLKKITRIILMMQMIYHKNPLIKMTSVIMITLMIIKMEKILIKIIQLKTTALVRHRIMIWTKMYKMMIKTLRSQLIKMVLKKKMILKEMKTINLIFRKTKISNHKKKITLYKNQNLTKIIQ